MAASAKITILLADEDALRRDGLAAVLSSGDGFEVVARAADGEAALGEIRAQRPDIAVVGLNLPRVHGIELIRRVRAESLGTKIIVVSGTSDDEIVREVIRAGGDGYLLRNGPARHLLDAISYVRDGGQYFSPQLQRDGRDRHLLEEPARTWQQPETGTAESSDTVDRDPDRQERAARADKLRRTRRSTRTLNDAVHVRQRIREESPGPELDDHDYEIMTRMADGIRPILDRLDEIDSRVVQMEEGAAPVPSDPRGWLSTQLADSLRDPRSSTEVALMGRNVNELEARLPQLIEEAVTRRFHQMAEKLQQEIEETHVRTLEAFVKNIQVKLVQRVSALENDMTKQAEAMGQLREHSQRTEDNLSRLISGVDKLAQELPKRLAMASEQRTSAERAARVEPNASAERLATGTVLDSQLTQEPELKERNRKRRPSDNRGIKIFWACVAGVTLLALLGWAASRFASRATAEGGIAAAVTAAASTEKTKLPPATADVKTKMQAAQECVDRKDYAVAEDLYKQIVKTEPSNTDALKGLASVLYREDKIEESAAILDKLSKN